MLTEYIVGLFFSLRFVGCGVQFSFFGHCEFPIPLIEFSFVHDESWILLCLGLCKLPSRYIEKLCVLWAVDFHNCRLSLSSSLFLRL